MSIIPKITCTCGIVLWDNHATAQVEPGSFLICIYCAQLWRLDDKMRGAAVTLETLPPETSLIERTRLRALIKIAARDAPEWRRRLEQQRRQH